MGIFINLYIQPHRISSDAWKAVYNETLSVIEHTPFMDRYSTEHSKHYYARRSKHIDNIFGKGCGGWRVCGSMNTGRNMEMYTMYDSIDEYRGDYTPSEKETSILEGIINDYWGVADIWGDKTQGEDAHLYLRAIGCLVCHRFPDAAYIDGDISRGQCERAVEWINQYLDVPIDVPLSASPTRLASALQKTGLAENELMSRFFRMNISGENSEVGSALTSVFGNEIIRKYYKDRLMESDRKECSVREYLSFGFDFTMLCRLMMTDADGCKIPPQEFAQMLLGMKLHIKDKTTRDYTKTSRDTGEYMVDNIDTLMSAIWAKLFGAGNRNVDAYIPLEEIEAAFVEVLGTPFSFSDLLVEFETKRNEDNRQSRLYEDDDSIFNFCNSEANASIHYDIASREALVNFTPESSIHPMLHDKILKAFRILRANDTVDEVMALKPDERLEWLKENYYYILTEEIEETIYSHVEDDDYIRPYIALSISGVDHSVTHASFYNKALLDHYWQLAVSDDPGYLELDAARRKMRDILNLK